MNVFRLQAIVNGHDQGVGFRFFVRKQAQNLKLAGWARNLGNGNVEVLAEGPKEDLVKFLDLLRQGPRGSAVANVQTEWSDGTGEFNSFAIAKTD